MPSMGQNWKVQSTGLYCNYIQTIYWRKSGTYETKLVWIKSVSLAFDVLPFFQEEPEREHQKHIIFEMSVDNFEHHLWDDEPRLYDSESNERLHWCCPVSAFEFGTGHVHQKVQRTRTH